MLKININESKIESFKDGIIIKEIKIITEELRISLQNGLAEADKQGNIYERLLFLFLLLHIEKIVLAKPDALENIWHSSLSYFIDKADIMLSQEINCLKERKRKFKNNKDEITKINQELKQEQEKLLKSRLRVIFETAYRKFSENCGYDFVEAIDIHTCPYCNQNYTLAVGNSKEKGLRPDLDHFLPKSEYPCFAISLYNLIPVCKQCNTKKNSKSFSIKTHLHPYYEGIDGTSDCEREVVFSYHPTNSNFIYGDEKAFLIDLRRMYSDEKTKKLKERIDKNFEELAIKDLYELHNSYVAEMIKKAHIYNDSYITELASSFPHLFKNKNEVKELALGIYLDSENMHKRPLAKLTRDIAEDLGLV